MRSIRNDVMGSCAQLILAALVVFSVSRPALGQTYSSDSLTARHVGCSRPAFKADSPKTMEAPGGYWIQVAGEDHWLDMDDRTSYSLYSASTGQLVANVKIDYPPKEKYEEQAALRARWLKEVADRAGVTLLEVSPAERSRLLTLNKKALTGKFAGLSVLFDAQRAVFLQWDWVIMAAYVSPEDLVKIQSSVWKQMLPCILEK